MKELIIGDMSVCSDDDDNWHTLLDTLRRATEIYRKTYIISKQTSKQSTASNFINKIIKFLFHRSRYVK